MHFRSPPSTVVPNKSPAVSRSSPESGCLPFAPLKLCTHVVLPDSSILNPVPQPPWHLPVPPMAATPYRLPVLSRTNWPIELAPSGP